MVSKLDQVLGQLDNDWLPEIDMAYTILSDVDTERESPRDVASRISDAASRIGGVLDAMQEAKKLLEKGDK